MEVVIWFKIYRLWKKKLIEVEFPGATNDFDSEEEAINFLIKANQTYQEFVILKKVLIRK